MIDRQKFRRVLASRYGVLTVLTLPLVFYILSLFEIPSRGSQALKDDPLSAVVYFLVLIPFGFFFWGWEKFDEEDRKQRLEENPHPKKELKEGERLIDFLYEDENEDKIS